MAVKSSVKIAQSFLWIKVYINGKLHLSVRKDELVGLQSWIEGEGCWCIDWELKDKTIYCEYSDIQIWSDILSEADKIM